MEQLRAYLAERRKADFAARIGTTPPYLSQILSGHRTPSLSLMRRIEQATGGDVDLNAWSETEGDAA